MNVSESWNGGSQSPFSLKRKVPPTTQLGSNPVICLQVQGTFWIFYGHLCRDRTALYKKKLSISHCSVAAYWEQKRNFSEWAQAKFNFQGFQTKSETLKNDFLYLLVLSISPRHVWNKNYFPYPYVDHFHLGNIWLFFSFPYSWKGLKLTISPSSNSWHSKHLFYVPPLLGMPTQFWENCISLLLKISQLRKYKIKVQIQQNAQYHPYLTKFSNGYWTSIKSLKALLNKSLYTSWVIHS